MMNTRLGREAISPVWILPATLTAMVTAALAEPIGRLQYGANMTEIDKLGAYFRRYSDVSFADEPAYGSICHGIADSPEVLALIAAHDPEAHQPNMILAAAQYLLLEGLNHPLGHVYTGASHGDPAPLFIDLVLNHRDAIDDLLATRHVQTNEVARCAVLSVGLTHIHRERPEPLAWIDLGASGGLNLLLDRYRIDYETDNGVATTGPLDSSVVIDSHLVGADPGIAPAAAPIAWRVGIDRSPIDAGDEGAARWLRANVWPSAKNRAARLDAALALAHDDPPRVVEADAGEGLSVALAEAPGDAQVVVTTSWVWYYLGETTRQAVLEVLRSAGRRVAWLSIEGGGVVDAVARDIVADTTAGSVVGLVTFDGNGREQARRLGLTHPHGTWLDWHPDPA